MKILTILVLLTVCYPVFGQRFPRTVNTIADLVNFPISTGEVNTNFVVLGYSAVGDGGGGDFYWHLGSTSTTNAGTIFPSTRAGAPLSKFKRKYSGRPSPRWAGATGNGTSDDTLAFQAMLNLNEGLFVPDGTYVISELDVPDNSVIEGQSFNATLKKKAGTVTYVLGSMNTNTYQNITVRNLRIYGNKANATAGGGIALAGRNIEISNVYIHETPDAGINLGYRAFGGSYRVLNSFFYNCSAVGKMYGAIAVTGGPDVKITGNQILCEDGGQAYGIDFEPNPGTPAADASIVSIEGNTIRGGTLQIDCSNVTGSPTNFINSYNFVDTRGAYDTGQDNMCPLFHRNLHGFKEVGNIVYSHESAATPFTGYYGWGNSDGEIIGNTFYVRDVPAVNDRIIYFDDAMPSVRITVAMNHIIALSGTPEYGIYSTFGATTNLYIFKNTFTGVTNPQFVNAENVHDWQTDLEFTNTWHQLLYATNANVLQRLRVGTQTNGDMLIVGSQTATGDAGFGSSRGVVAFADGNSSMAHRVAFNTETNTTAGLKQVDVLYNTAGTGLRAAQWQTRKLSTWLPGLESSYVTLGLLSNSVPVDALDFRGDLINFNLPVIVQPLTASQLVGSSAGKALQSITLGTGLSFAGTTLNAAASTTINPTTARIPVKISSAAFGDSPVSVVSSNQVSQDYRVADDFGPTFVFLKQGRTGSATNTPASGAQLGVIGFGGWNGTSDVYGQAIRGIATEAWTPVPAATGYKLDFYTIATGSSSQSLRMTIDQDGRIKVPQLTANNYLGVDGSNYLVVTNAPGAGGTTINATDGFLPYRLNSGAFADSGFYFISTYKYGLGGTTKFLASENARSISLGFTALNANTSGADGTAIGDSALKSNTTGIRNTAVGSKALELNVIGQLNTAIGYAALRFSTNSSGANTAIGDSALTGLTSGTENNASGANSLVLVTTGSRNVANGRSSAESLITGSDVVAIGAYAAQKTTVSETTAVGAYALSLNTNGTANTAFGFHAAKTNSGSFNTAIGNSALKANTTGSHNTALGAITATAAITDTNSIVIGSNVTGAGSNTTVIGNTNTTAAHIIASGYAGGGTKFLSDDGTYKTATGADATATSWQAIGSGTDHSYIGAIATFEKISFGTSGPSFTLTNAGTYNIFLNIAAFDAGTFYQDFWITNVTDNVGVPGSYRSLSVSSSSVYGQTLPIILQITTSASNRNFELWGQTHNATYTSSGVFATNTVLNVVRLF